MEDIVKGYQVKMQDGTYEFVSHKELYGQEETSNNEKMLLLKQYRKMKEVVQTREPISPYKLMFSIAAILIGVSGTVLLVQHLGFLWGFLSAGGILLVVGFLAWMMDEDSMFLP